MSIYPLYNTLTSIRRKLRTHRHKDKNTSTLNLTNLQLSGCTDCVFSKVQMASFQSTVEHIPCLCFLYHPFLIFPLMADQLQVRGRQKKFVQIMNQQPTAFFTPCISVTSPLLSHYFCINSHLDDVQ